jgi:hypothetical protein
MFAPSIKPTNRVITQGKISFHSSKEEQNDKKEGCSM